VERSSSAQEIFFSPFFYLTCKSLLLPLPLHVLLPPLFLSFLGGRLEGFPSSTLLSAEQDMQKVLLLVVGVPTSSFLTKKSTLALSPIHRWRRLSCVPTINYASFNPSGNRNIIVGLILLLPPFYFRFSSSFLVCKRFFLPPFGPVLPSALVLVLTPIPLILKLVTIQIIDP